MSDLASITKMVDEFETLSQQWKAHNKELIDKGIFIEEFQRLTRLVAYNIRHFAIDSYSPKLSLDEFPMLWQLDSITFFDIIGTSLLRKDRDSSSFVQLYLLENGQYAEILTLLSEHSHKREILAKTFNPLETWGTREVLGALSKCMQDGVREYQLKIKDLQWCELKLGELVKAGEPNETN